MNVVAKIRDWSGSPAALAHYVADQFSGSEIEQVVDWDRTPYKPYRAYRGYTGTLRLRALLDDPIVEALKSRVDLSFRLVQYERAAGGTSIVTFMWCGE